MKFFFSQENWEKRILTGQNRVFWTNKKFVFSAFGESKKNHNKYYVILVKKIRENRIPTFVDWSDELINELKMFPKYYQFSCLYFRLNAKGGKTLSLLHEKCVTQSLASTDKLRELGLSLTRSAAEAYFEVILYRYHELIRMVTILVLV